VDQVFPLPLEPLAYHVEMIHYLQSEEADLWKWFASGRLRAQQNDEVRLDLLKSTYRVEPDANGMLYASAEDVARDLGLNVPITFYQAQTAVGLNASLAYMPGEAHVVFTGPVTTTLTGTELRCVLGHELLHFGLLDRWSDYLIASQILSAMTNDAQAEPSHFASARLFQLYSEVYCDRGAHRVTGDLDACITSLVKLETGTTDVSADSYLRQTQEIFDKGHPRSEGVTHPETFIRVKAMQLWVEQDHVAAAEIARTIEGPLSLSELDLLAQQKVSGLTRRLIAALLRPAWLRTEATLAHARLFFDDFQPAGAVDGDLASDLACDNENLRDYFCYVMLDFAVADRDLEEAPLAAAMLLSDALGLGERFRQLAVKELKLRKKQMEAIEANAATIVARAAEATD